MNTTEMTKEGWGYLEAYSPYDKPPPTSHYFIPDPPLEGEWDEEDGRLPLCGQHFGNGLFSYWDEYGIVIGPSDRPKCKKCLKALAKWEREK